MSGGSNQVTTARFTVICLLMTTVILATLLPWPWQVVDPRDPLTSATLMVAAGALWALIAWGAVVLMAAVAGRSAGRLGRIGRAVFTAVAPRVARGLLVTAVGVGAGIGLTGPAAAAAVTGDGPAPVGAVENPHTAVVLDVDWPGPSIDWPTDGPTPTPVADNPAATPAGPVEYVVLRGDTLWSIAARHLPAEADAAAISAGWQQWYAANRDVIGPDPDLILPGQRLIAPAPTTPGGSS